MTIASVLLHEYPAMNEAQRAVVAYDEGPLLVIAGPGSGKTFSLVLRALNLLLLNKATPRELVICTFTEKAAFELRDRISAAAQKVGYTGDLSELRVGTIHGLCNRLLTEHRHRTSLGNNYQTLDELTQVLFIFEHFDEIIGSEMDGQYLGKWGTRWTAIEGARAYFDKITEELVEAEQLQNDRNPALQQMGKAYLAYQHALFTNNCVDFAHLQKLLYDLLLDPEIAQAITRGVKYVLVDEYQDTNFIQEQILLRLSAVTGNLCVVGDEDQSLYRFRGATVRNILEFTARFPNCAVVKLTTNYRSHERIVTAYDRWMASADWSNPRGLPFRYDKAIQPDPHAQHLNYPAIFAIWGKNPQDEAARFADLVAFLRESGVIQDYNQVALLLHSVRSEHSGPYLAALAAKSILAFCPRARAYFDNDEVRLMVGCLAVIFGYYGEGRRVLNGKLATLNEARIRTLLERTFSFLTLADVRPIGAAAKESAFRQVINYFCQNQDDMRRVIETEVNVSVEKDDYILTGKIDLLMGSDGKLELLDFKTAERPINSPQLLAAYERQLCTYAHILEQRYGKRPDRLLLYWTAEPCKVDALMEFPYRSELVDEAGLYFDAVVKKIREKDFRVVTVPERKVCKECDLRSYCFREGTIKLRETEL